MLLNKFLVFFTLSLLLVSCISRSAQAKLRKENTIPPPKVKSVKDNIDDSVNSIKFFFYPTSTTGQIIYHNYYSLSYSEKDEQAEWVAYKIISRKLNNINRTNDFRDDPFVKTGSSNIYDYQGNGYDRGHLVPAKSMSINETSMSESFFMSNISPQIPEFNRGLWKRLESKVRYWAEANDSLYITTGPILSHPIDLIGDNNVTVPRAFYKTLISFKNGKSKGIAFIMPNRKSDKSIYSYVTSIDEVEKITGIDFYYNLDNQTQTKVEANNNLKEWIPTN